MDGCCITSHLQGACVAIIDHHVLYAVHLQSPWYDEQAVFILNIRQRNNDDNNNNNYAKAPSDSAYCGSIVVSLRETVITWANVVGRSHLFDILRSYDVTGCITVYLLSICEGQGGMELSLIEIVTRCVRAFSDCYCFPHQTDRGSCSARALTRRSVAGWGGWKAPKVHTSRFQPFGGQEESDDRLVK